MDYDENDFQSQNPHSAGEGNNRIPPVLRSYPLPKFDFDDGLHGSLRFDGLVEAEVFLGIESNEDHHWIEDFSRGGSVIQFSSSTSEPCSMLGGNNVWSEATSSESVEMLLKSVGQEEVVLLQTNSKESDACDELGCIIKQMDSSLRKDIDTPFKVRDVVQPRLSSGEIAQNMLVSGNVDGGEHPDDEVSLQQMDSSLRKDGDTTNVRGVVQPGLSPGEIAQNILVSGNVDGGKHPDDEGSLQGRNAPTLAGGGLGNCGGDMLTVTEGIESIDTKCNVLSENKVDMVLSKSHDILGSRISASVIEVDGGLSSVQSTITEDNENALQPVKMTITTDNIVHYKKSDVLSPQRLMMNDPILDAEVIKEEANTTKAKLDNVKEPFCTMQKNDSSIENVSVMNDQSELNIHKVLEMGSKENAISGRHEIEEVTSPEVVNEKLQNKHGTSSMCEDEGPLETVDESGKSHTVDSLTAVFASAKSHCERNSEDHVSCHHVALESSKGAETKMATGECNVHKLDVDAAMEDEENVAVATDNVSADVEVSVSRPAGGGAGPSSSVEDRTESELMFAAATEKRSVDNVLTCPGNGDNQDVINSKSVELPCDSEKDMAIKISNEKSSFDVSSSSHLATGEDSYSGIIGQVSCPADQTLSVLNACNAEAHQEPQPMIMEEAKVGCEKEKEECPVLSDLAANREHGYELPKEIDGKLLEEVDPSISKMEKLVPESSALQESCQDIGDNSGEKNEIVVVAGDTGLSNLINSDPGKIVDVTKLASNSPANCSSGDHSKNETDEFMVKGSSDQVFPKVDHVDTGLDKLAFRVLKQSDAISDEKGFIFQKTAKEPQTTSSAPQVGIPVVEGSPSTSGLCQSDPKTVLDLPHEGLKASDVIPFDGSQISDVIPRGGSQGNSERRGARRSSGKASGKEAAKRGNPSKESAPRCIEKREGISGVSCNLSGTPCVLPDLNSSSSPAGVLQQPFTDMQQVQLRAQIFVYGALIQGTAPDEAYMISAFGGPDGGKGTWEKAWHSCIDRLHGQKPHLVTPQTPFPSSYSGSRAPDQANKQGAPESKVSSNSGRTNGKGTHSTIVCPMVPLSSPLWSLSTPSTGMLQPSGMPREPVVDFQHAFSPLHHHQNTPVRNLVGLNPSWISQSPFHGPWVASPQTAALDASARFPLQLPPTEPVRLTPVKESSLQLPTSKHVTPVSASQSGFTTGVLGGASTSTGVTNISASSGQSATETKYRRRKKALVSENLEQVIKPSQTRTEPIQIPTFSGQPPCSVAITSAIGFTTKASAENLNASSSSLHSNDLTKVTQDTGRRAILSDEALGKVKEARVQADEASVLAAVALSHSQEIWSQLDRQRKSGLLPDIATKLASAAVAIAAAAAVAKAAAAAANVASNAALQTKLMAEETAGDRCGDNCQTSATSQSDAMKSFRESTPVSILKGDAVNCSNAILVAEKETARRKVEAASAASKHAENVDAIVKAAELAAEAISQAGKIVTMSDPLPLAELVAAGPEGYWKVAQVASEPASKSHDVGADILKMDNAGASDTSASLMRHIPSSKKETLTTGNGNSSASEEMFNEDHMRLIDVFSGTGVASLKDAKGRKFRKASDFAKTIRVVPESEVEAKSVTDPNRGEDMVEALEKQDSIQEGSRVEIFKDGDGLKAAWFTAHVMSLNEEKAYVCYTDLTTIEGAEKLKEWVELKGKGDSAPKIRIARPISAMPFEGTRKRRRSAMGDYKWSVGDKVDAWMRDSWCEGVITEKNNKDETILTVHFPAHGETDVVRAWHLRPSLTWRDGEWIECSSRGENNRSCNMGDTPQEKRPRVLSPAVVNKGKDTMSKSADSVESDKPDEPTLLEISADEKIFNIGKSTRDNKPSNLRMTRTGFQKETSRVVIGVPKPGKKRKFMEVSKHYDMDRSGKTNDSNDSVKFAKYLIPQGSSRGWKHSYKPAPNDKQAALSKPKVSKSGKLQSFTGRSNSQNVHSSSSSVAAMDATTISNKNAETKNPENPMENASMKTQMEFQSLSTSDGAASGPVLLSSRALSSDSLASKRPSASTSKFERAIKGKLAPASSKLGKIEENKVLDDDSGKMTTDIVEPRRSNRRIQPTSRLLEGLQTSLMVSKLPFVSHDKGHRSTKGNSHG